MRTKLSHVFGAILQPEVKQKLPSIAYVSEKNTYLLQMGVSKNSGKTPKVDGLFWKTLLKFMIWGYPYFWKHPNLLLTIRPLSGILHLFLKTIHGIRRREIRDGSKGDDNVTTPIAC